MAVFLALAVSAYGSVSAMSWDPSELGGSSRGGGGLGAHELRAVTLNAWKLWHPARVAGYVEALRKTGEVLGAGDRGDLPELFAAQELESRGVVRALIAEVDRTHEVTVCECATDDDGSLRSAVAIAADRRFFMQTGQRCVALDRVWPDHARCAVVVDLEHEGRALHAVGVHLTWHPEDVAMAERLRAAIEPAIASGDPVLVLGDLNAEPGSAAYEAIVRGSLIDTRRGAPATHFAGGRIDYVLASRARFVRGLARRASFDALAPGALIWVPGACSRGVSSECPVSDHLPEGAVLSLDR